MKVSVFRSRKFCIGNSFLPKFFWLEITQFYVASLKFTTQGTLINWKIRKAINLEASIIPPLTQPLDYKRRMRVWLS